MARLQRRNYGRGHGYKLDGEKIIGVTTVLKARSAPGLINWSADETAKAAVNRWDELAEMPPADRYQVLLKARYETLTEASTRGTEIHKYGEDLAHGRDTKVPDHLVGPVEGYARFLDLWDVHVVATEAPCVSTRWWYAGTLDSVAEIGRLGELSLLDLKSGKGVYAEAALQLAGYRYCDLWQPGKDAAGKIDPASEEPMVEVESVYVAHIGPDATRLIPVDAGEAEHRQFLYTLQCALWDRAVEDGDSPILAALDPNDCPESTEPKETDQ
jgi:hypothetical protein